MKILYKRIVPLTIITTMITSNCIVFARDSKFLSSETGFKANFVGDIISDAADLDNIEITQNNIIDIVNEIDDSAMVTQDDIIVKEDKNGSEMYVVPYSKREQPTMAVSVSDIASNLKSDPDISNLKLDGNVLTYTMFNTTDVKIVENIDEYGVCVLEITEGDKTDSLTFDTSNNKIMLNDDIIEVELVESYVFQKDTLLESNSTSSSWVYYGVIYPNLRAEQSIRNIPLAALTTLFLGSFGWKGTITGFVQSVISTLNSANNDTKSIYCIRNIYRTSDGYYLFKYYDALYADSSYNFHIKTRIWEQYE